MGDESLVKSHVSGKSAMWFRVHPVTICRVVNVQPGACLYKKTWGGGGDGERTSPKTHVSLVQTTLTLLGPFAVQVGGEDSHPLLICSSRSAQPRCQ